MLKKTILFCLCIFFGFNLFIFFYIKNYSIDKNNFLKIEDVKMIDKFYSDIDLFQPAANDVTIILKNGHKFRIMSFDKNIFDKTDSFIVSDINGKYINCMKNLGEPYLNSVSYNFIDFIKSSPLSIKINNIKDFIRNYDVIYDYVNILPTQPDRSVVIKMKSFGTKDVVDHWCFVESVENIKGSDSIDKS